MADTGNMYSYDQWLEGKGDATKADTDKFFLTNWTKYGEKTARYISDYLAPNYGMVKTQEFMKSPYLKDLAEGGADLAIKNILTSKGLQATPTAMNEIKAHYAVTGGSWFDYLKDFANSPASASEDLTNQKAKIDADRIKAETAAEREKYRGQIKGEYEGAGGVEDTANKYTQMLIDEQRKKGLDALSTSLAARGIGNSGEVQAGTEDLTKNLAEQAAKSALQIKMDSLSRQGADVERLTAGGVATSADERNKGLSSLAESLASTYNTKAENEYAKRQAATSAAAHAWDWLTPVATLAGIAVGQPWIGPAVGAGQSLAKGGGTSELPVSPELRNYFKKGVQMPQRF